MNTKFLIIFFLSILIVGCNPYIKYIKNVKNSGHYHNEDRSKTLSGIDKNENQVRDDVENYIISKYGDHPEYVDALFRVSMTIWMEMHINSEDREVYRKLAIQSMQDMVCLSVIASKYAVPTGEDDYIEIVSIHMNTKKRREHNQKISRMLSGMVFSLPRETDVQCN